MISWCSLRQLTDLGYFDDFDDIDEFDNFDDIDDLDVSHGLGHLGLQLFNCCNFSEYC